MADPASPESIGVSVTELIALVGASGDLHSDGPAGPSARDGIRAHQRLQAERADWEAERRVGVDIPIDGAVLHLSGRIDLVDPLADPPALAEIKSCLAPPDKLPAGQRETHWRQLRLYGWLYAQTLDPVPETVALSLLWANLRDGRTYEDGEVIAVDALREEVHALAHRYLALHRLVSALAQQGRESARTLDFPFEAFRSGQRTLAAGVYRAVRDGGRLLAEAPTGIGKTLSTVFPALRAFGETHCDHVLFLTARNSGRLAADAAVGQLRQKGLQVCSLQLVAKAQACPCRSGELALDEQGRCPRTVGFFDRLSPARESLLRARHIDPPTLRAAADEHQLCPFELSLQLLPFADLVIADLNYCFDPLVRLSALGERARRTALLIDEAHNLPDRARGMFGAALARGAALHAADLAGDSSLKRAWHSVARAIARATREVDQDAALDGPPETVARAVEKALSASIESPPPPGEAAEWQRELLRYSAIEALYGETHCSIATARGKQRSVSLHCLDARDLIAPLMASYGAVVAFSATLRPMPMLRDAMGLPESTLGMSLPSPFDPARLAVLSLPHIDTRAAHRETAAPALVQALCALVDARRGNYLAYLPSHAFLQQVYQTFVSARPDVAAIAQQRDDDPAARARFLDAFSESGAVLGFAVLGGVHGEGVDLRGDRLNGVLIAGPGLPALDTVHRLREQHLDAQGMDGFEHASRVPGMTRVVQAAGRVIRDHADAGVVLLADRRFEQAPQRALFPPHWQTRSVRAEALPDCLRTFWMALADHP